MKTVKFCGIAGSTGLLIGLLLGWHLGRSFTRGRVNLEEMSAPAAYGKLAALQYERADTPHARQALLGFTNFSRSVSKLPSAQQDKALQIDTGRVYLRLAALEELAGNGSLSHQYLLSAQESFRRFGREIPEEELNKQVTKIIASTQTGTPAPLN
jgi:hypothetical protein